MESTLKEFRRKEIINITDGVKIGYVDDIAFNIPDPEGINNGGGEFSSFITHLVVRGRYKMFGLFGRNDDLLIPWRSIVTFGEDTLLIRFTADEKKDVKLDTSFGGIADFIKGIFR